MPGFKEADGMKRLMCLILLIPARLMTAAEDDFTARVQELKQIDPALVHYEQVKTVDAGVQDPGGLGVDDGGMIYTAGSTKLKIWNRDLDAARELTLTAPATALAVDGAGTVYVGTKVHVEVIPPEGEPVQWADLGEDSHITSIALAGGKVFVADAGQRVIWKFSKEGKLEGRLGDAGSFAGRKGFIIPSASFDVAAAGDGTLWIVNPGMHTLININTEGEKIRSFKKSSQDIEGFCGCCNPSHIALLPDGSIVTGEKGLMRVKVVSPDGDLKSVVAGPLLFEKDDPHAKLGAGALPGKAEAVADLAVRGEQVLVLDRNAGLLRIFEKKVAK